MSDAAFRKLMDDAFARLGLDSNYQPPVTHYDVSFEHTASKYGLGFSVRVLARNVLHGWEVFTGVWAGYRGLPWIKDTYFVPHMPKINALLYAMPNQEYKLWNWRHTDEHGVESQILTDDEIAEVLQRIKGQIYGG